MPTQAALSTMLLATALAACAPAEPPASPSWDLDVFPILQGSCNHCHGELVGQHPTIKAPFSRLDVCDGGVFATNQISLPGVNILGAGAPYANTLVPMLTVAKGASRPLMPPPPASPLSDYDSKVLLAWAKLATTPDACIKKGKNRVPSVRATQKLDGDNLAVTLDVTDPDGDQVLGKVSAGNSPAQTIIASGRRTFFFAGLSVGVPVRVILHDGYERVEVDL